VFPSRRQLALICLVWAVVAWYTVAVWAWKATDTDFAGAFGNHYAARAPIIGAVMGFLWSPLFVLGYHPARVLMGFEAGRDPIAEDTAGRHVGRYFRGAVLGQFVGASISLALLALWPIEMMNSRWDALKWAGVFWKLYWYMFVPAAAIAGAGSVAMAARHRLRPTRRVMAEGDEPGTPAWHDEPELLDVDAWGSLVVASTGLDLDRVEQASARVGVVLLAERGGPGPWRLGGADGLRVAVALRPPDEDAGGAVLIVTLTGAPVWAVARDSVLARVLAAVSAGTDAVTVRVGDVDPVGPAALRAAVSAALPPHLPAELFVSLRDVEVPTGAAASSRGLARYGLPEVQGEAADADAARAVTWTMVRRVLVSGESIASAPHVAAVPHPDGGGGRLLRYVRGAS
jgi:hypothetical protein